MPRWIFHADIDAFFASVEQRDNPELRGKPVIVGGPPEARAVVTTASYEARPFGVHSAMPMSRALRLCPGAIRISPRFDRYAEVSRDVMRVFRAVTEAVEPLSLDEAFLDVSPRVSSEREAEALARHIKAQVHAATDLTASIGVGSNKTVAKIASDMQKPDGLVIVPTGTEAEFLAPLPVRALWGVGPRAEEALVAAGLKTIGELAAAGEETARSLLGSRGPFLVEIARGIDDRPVETGRERKSVGAETTFPRDLPDGPELREELRRLTIGVAERLGARALRTRTIVLKLRYSNFRTITRRSTRAQPTDAPEDILSQAEQLLDAVLSAGDRFRLIGIHATSLTATEERAQLPLFAYHL